MTLPPSTRTSPFAFSAHVTRAQRSAIRGASGTVRHASGTGLSEVAQAAVKKTPSKLKNRIGMTF
jgi:hypothetical protein